MMETLGMKMNEHDLHDHDGKRNGGMDEDCIICCISSMLQQEEDYLCHGYLDDEIAAAAAMQTEEVIDENCRSKMCEWIFHVIDSTRLQRETASVAMSLLDRFLCTNSHRAMQARLNRKEYQLAAMTCLYIAVKIGEPFEMDASLMSKLSRGIHTAAEITELEYEILISLQWKMCSPTPFQFVNYILSLLPDSANHVASLLYENSHFQTELATGDYAFVPHMRHSTIAVAAILNSLSSVNHQTNVAFDECIHFVREISKAFQLDIDSPLVNAVRERLLHSFAKSSGYELCQNITTEGLIKRDEKKDSPVYESPACVLKEAAISIEGYR
eukprot:1001947_1